MYNHFLNTFFFRFSLKAVIVVLQRNQKSLKENILHKLESGIFLHSTGAKNLINALSNDQECNFRLACM